MADFASYLLNTFHHQLRITFHENLIKSRIYIYIYPLGPSQLDFQHPICPISELSCYFKAGTVFDNMFRVINAFTVISPSSLLSL